MNPSLLLLVETELWPNLIHEASRRGTRVALVNGRISPRSFPRYKRVRRFLASVLGEIDLFLMQGKAHAERIREMAAPPDRVRVTGNLKFDAVETPRLPERLVRLMNAGGARRRSGSRAARWTARRSWCSRPSTVCASACRRRDCWWPRAIPNGSPRFRA